mgnify:CR=1 FL=1
MSGDRGLIVLAVAVIALVLVGEVAAYGNLYGYDSEVSEDGSFRVHSSGSNVYDIVSSDNGSFQSVRKLIVYSDDSYGGVVHGVTVEVGARALDEEYYLSQLSNNLEYLGFSDIATANAASLKDALARGAPAGTGIVVVHGALPDTVYSGSPGDAILSWISAGGTLYWAGEALGKYIGHADGTVSLAPEGYQSLFLGSECILDLEISDVPGDNRNVGRAYSRADSGGYSEALHMKNNNVLYGVDPSLLDGREALCTGYCQDGHYSVSLVSLGSGCVCVMGGTFSNYQRMDLANVIAAGIGPASTLAGVAHGTVSHGTAEGSVPVGGGNSSMFVLLGGDFSVYGRTFYREAP